jgi:hypothetical protein
MVERELVALEGRMEKRKEAQAEVHQPNLLSKLIKANPIQDWGLKREERKTVKIGVNTNTVTSIHSSTQPLTKKT